MEQNYLYLHPAGITEKHFIVSSRFSSWCGEVRGGISFGGGTLSFEDAKLLRDWLINSIKEHEKKLQLTQ